MIDQQNDAEGFSPGPCKKTNSNQLTVKIIMRPIHALFICLFLIAGCQQSPPPTGTQTVTISGRTFHLELATDDASRYQGLSDREHIADDGGMLFVFPSARELAFVMRRCLVPIDLIYLDPTGRIVALHAMTVEPYDRSDAELKKYRSGWPAQFAIELQAGMIDQLSLKTGQLIQLPLDELKQLAQ